MNQGWLHITLQWLSCHSQCKDPPNVQSGSQSCVNTRKCLAALCWNGDIQNKDGPVTFLPSSILLLGQGKALRREKQLKKAVPFIRGSCCVLRKDQWQSQAEEQQRWEWNIGGKRLSLMDPIELQPPFLLFSEREAKAAKGIFQAN